MPAYVVAMINVHDPETYRKYTERTPATVKKHGGRFVTRGGAVTALEGDGFDGRMVILEFPDRASAEAWYADPEYVQDEDLPPRGLDRAAVRATGRREPTPGLRQPKLFDRPWS